jgi:hypothetical protein
MGIALKAIAAAMVSRIGQGRNATMPLAVRRGSLIR